ncbi:MAG: ferrous iron transport protein A [Verrucomicrobiae bacterium]|nr:ferrous iron transport protein A [Verrucomicrobiae bacterium]
MNIKKVSEPRAHATGASAGVCPLSRVAPGALVRIKQLTVSAAEAERLRELGLAERRQIKLIKRRPSYVCQVGGSQLWLNKDLAENILVEPVPDAAAKVYRDQEE